jgi:hypothetical protein
LKNYEIKKITGKIVDKIKIMEHNKIMLNMIKEILEKNPSLNIFLDNLKNNEEPNRWSEDFLYDILAFDMEIHKIKRGKIFKSEPKNKDNKTNNIFSVDNNIIAAFSYIPNWNEPSAYIFVEKVRNYKVIYRYNIQKKLTVVFLQEYNIENCLKNVFSVNENKNFTIASINKDRNIIINLQAGFNFDEMENKSNSIININFKGKDTIEIIRVDGNNKSDTVYLGVNPYIDKPFSNPL